MNIYTSKTEFLEAENKRLHALNADLLEAIKKVLPTVTVGPAEIYPADDTRSYGERSIEHLQNVNALYATIAKAEGEQK